MKHRAGGLGYVTNDDQPPTTTNNHQQPPTTTNHHQPPTTTNNHQQPPTTTNNHQQPPTTTNNQQPPTTTNNHQQPPTTTNNHQPPTTTNHQQPPTTTNHQQPPTTTNNHQQPPTTTNDQQPPTTTNDQQPPTTTNNHQQPPTTNNHQRPTTTNNHQQPPTTTNHQQPPTTTNHQQPPTTTNHQQPPTTTNNHQQPPTTNNNHQQPPTSSNNKQHFMSRWCPHLSPSALGSDLLRHLLHSHMPFPSPEFELEIRCTEQMVSLFSAEKKPVGFKNLEHTGREAPPKGSINQQPRSNFLAHPCRDAGRARASAIHENRAQGPSVATVDHRDLSVAGEGRMRTGPGVSTHSPARATDRYVRLTRSRASGPRGRKGSMRKGESPAHVGADRFCPPPTALQTGRRPPEGASQPLPQPPVTAPTLETPSPSSAHVVAPHPPHASPPLPPPPPFRADPSGIFGCRGQRPDPVRVLRWHVQTLPGAAGPDAPRGGAFWGCAVEGLRHQR